METNKLIAGIVAAAIAIIVLAGVLMPALSNATTTHETFTNEGYYNMAKADTDTNVTLTWERDTPNIINIGDGSIDVSVFAENNFGYTIVGGDKILVRYYPTSSSIAVHFFGNPGDFSNPSTISSFEFTTVTISVVSNVVTFSMDNSSSYTKTLTCDQFVYYMTPEKTDYVMKKADTPAYMNGDSEFTMIGVSVSPGVNGICQYGVGTIDDGATMTNIYKRNITTLTYSDVTIDDTESTSYNDLYLLDDCKFTINYDADTYDATYSYFIVPAEVTAERSVHLTDAMNVILNVIPLLIIVAVLLGVTAVFILRRE